MNSVFIIVMVLVVCVICSVIMGGGYYFLQQTTTPIEKSDNITTDVIPKTETSVTPKIDTTVTPKVEALPSSATAWSTFTVGQAVNCSKGDPKGDNSGATYRYTGNNTISHYPTPDIASSWDPAWGNPKTIDCTGLTKGPDMTAKASTTISTPPTSATPSWASFAVGQAVNCNAGDPKGANSGATYRYTGSNSISHYPNPDIASSWDPNWWNPKTIDCTGLTKGTDMTMKATPWSTFAVGQAVNCNAGDPKGANSGATYRYTGNNTISHYPSPEIASSWDPNYWNTAKTIDCTGLTKGTDMTMKATPWSTFAVGQAVNCNAGDPLGINTGGANGGGTPIYRYTSSNTMSRYPTSAIASSWDPYWNSPKTINCTGLTKGIDMTAKATPWSTFAVGQAVNCNAGDPLEINTGGANGGGTPVYRYTGSNAMSRYPTASIASSWDPYWNNPKTINCTGLTRGSDMTTKPSTTTSAPPPTSTSTTPWASFAVGQATNCSAGDPLGANSGAIYRYAGSNTIRHYPTPEIAAKWDPNWASPRTINCSGLTKGTNMT